MKSFINIITMIKPRRIKWRGHVASMGRRMNIGFCWERQKKIDHYEDLDVGGRIILKCIADRMGRYVLN
jgi:hypothetical protein